MTETTSLNLNPNHGQPQIDISVNPLLNKKGSVEPTSETNEGPLFLQNIEQFLNRTIGSTLHAAFHEFCVQKLITATRQQNHQAYQLSMKIPRPTVAEITNESITTWLEFAQKISRPLTKLKQSAVTKTANWLESFQSYALSPEMKAKLTSEQKKYYSRESKIAAQVHGVLLSGLVELWPDFNQPATLVLSELRLQPPTYAIKRLANLLTNPEKVKNPLDLKTALSAGSQVAGSLDDYLFNVLVKKRSLHEGFDSLIDKLTDQKIIKKPEDLIQLLNKTKEMVFTQILQKNFNQRNLNPTEMKTLQALRIVHQARLQMEFFLGGKAFIKNKDHLVELLKVFPLINPPETLTQEEKNKIFQRLPKQMRRILSPIFMIADVLVLEMSEKNETFLALQKFCAQAYAKNQHPALFQNPEFLALATKAAKEGMKIKLGDIKTSRQPIIEKGVKTEHGRELAFYNLTLFVGSVASWLHNQSPEKNFSVFEVLKHPLVQALKENFIIYFGYKNESKNIIPQIAIRTAFVDPADAKNKQLRQRFVKLMHQITDSMLIRQFNPPKKDD